MAELTLPDRVSRLEEILAEQISEYERAKAVPPPAPVEAEEGTKQRKKGPMSDEARAAMAAKRVATMAAKKVASAGRRRTVKTIRMKKGEYLREHHHLFRVLQNPTRRALNAELRRQQKELKERGLRG
jgi:hypothetical protein